MISDNTSHMSPGSGSRQSTLPMKTREISSYASNHILRTSPVSGIDSSFDSRVNGGVNHMPQHSNSVVDPGQLSRQTFVCESPGFSSVDTSNALGGASHRPSGEPGSRGTRGRRADKRNTKNALSVCLTKALSLVAQDNPKILVEDVETFAGRPADKRRAEATAVGRVKRPLNAFMLYRKAYQNVAKYHCRHNNHQQVSAVCGASWKMELQPVKDEYNELAGREKRNHEAAFPAYKYDPVQTKKPKDGTNHDSNTCDLSDGGSGCPPRRSGRQRTARSPARLDHSFPLEVPSQYHGMPTCGSLEQNQFLPDPEWNTHGRPAMGASEYTSRGGGHNPIDPAAGAPYACTSSGPQFTPPYYQSFIDPYLEPPPRNGVPDSQSAQFLGANHGMLSDWMNVGGVTAAHTAYLQGTGGDWQAEPLEDGSHFSQWMTQAGNGEQQ